MNRMFGHLDGLLVNFDAILVFSKSAEAHKQHLQQLLDLLKAEKSGWESKVSQVLVGQVESACTEGSGAGFSRCEDKAVSQVIMTPAQLGGK